MRRVVVLWALHGCAAEPLSEDTQATTVCARGEVVHGMDVSAYETSIDWPTAKAAGVEFAFIRVSDGMQHRDPRFAEYWAGAQAGGVMRGAYQFFRPTQDPIAQAELLLDAIGPRQLGDLPPVIDVETTGGLAAADVAAAVRAWVAHVAAAIGRPPIIYAGYYSWQDYTDNANLTGSPLWHAQYTSAPCPNIPTPWTDWTFWQHTAMGRVPSVIGELTDLDVFNGSRADLEAFADHAPAACGMLGEQGGEIDDSAPCFSAGGPAATLRHVAGSGERDGLIWTHATASDLPGNFARWSLALAAAGSYRVEVYTAGAYAQSHHARYRVRAAGELHELELDQAAADGWQTLGELEFSAGGDQDIELDDNTGEAGGSTQLVFDAVRLTRLDLPPPTLAIPPDEDVDEGGCSAGGSPSLLAFALLLGVRRRVERTAATSGVPAGTCCE